MGYTNYWNPKKLTEEEIPEQFWDDAEKVLDKIMSTGVKLASGNGEKLFKTGHEVINDTLMSDQKYPSICFNGYEDESFEPFALEFNGEWNFCKTARCPYDLAVKCILLLANHYNLLKTDLKDDASWDFDGDKTDEEYIKANNIMLELQLI